MPRDGWLVQRRAHLQQCAECMGGFRATADCVGLYGSSFTCVTANTGPICAAGTACDPTTYVDSCMGMNQVDYCNAGLAAAYNCRNAAWNRCVGGHCSP
jgi:hypothetical protein